MGIGTCADFYVDKGWQAEYMGSLRFDGYPLGIEEPILKAGNELDYRNAVTDLITRRRDGNHAEQGWPHLWADSGLTDYSYTFVRTNGVYGHVEASRWGMGWFRVDLNQLEPRMIQRECCLFPDMHSKEHRSGQLYGKQGG